MRNPRHRAQSGWGLIEIRTWNETGSGLRVGSELSPVPEFCLGPGFNLGSGLNQISGLKLSLGPGMSGAGSGLDLGPVKSWVSCGRSQDLV